MQLFTSSVGRKVLMAITGQFMVLFVIVHMLGNSSIFIPGGINAYAEHLHALPPLVWAFRLVMLVAAGIHILFGIQLSLENRAANPDTYAVKNYKKATMGSLSMLYTGLLLLSFIIYHLLHFTIRATPDIKLGVDSLGRFDVFGMVTNSFSHGIIAFIYIAAMVVLFLHLSHGIQSFFQTMGWNNDKSLPVFSKIGMIAAVVLLLGYATIPFVIVTGILKG
ncbi:succinate dehydrogenase cytochrome b subunit [Geobacter sulfurreducens]|jgi:succinate dehydrogenase / fumarate reductase cytochrome b subunit|uniref:Succinate dehydrogenase/fumarate reductase, cytochrome b558 subunit n=1 Tax=Geobacter sulfurreducens (strain ATCC 51573 / DSM 12127 / PCA) TaxID=243231 RepID=Q74DY9_GEOSL|nr:succinate dehydrogenase cytochrome b subunit [Geobacter sulfurreducens]AAR34552.1 succinate dehydrogenase/fumarate reductase, cytochrome b558 subunit [Geobacter sulfurreducens PCA]AJY70895.1 fumarate reductase [Geobacter sulfurreducens]QVW36399.1 succinate dehydrogenase cytochrome b subunit [Geobacter sulfurreducens]UAC05213.1 succinate dehydrogenase cytochrome b subunit [Geobacter sulfurreducens]HBB69233.1 succinate dehydrogenase/fumarate reductase cytochrome b subunit [Geobacter sulfurred